MEEKINLVDIFKYVKEGTKFYCSTHGDVTFHSVLNADCIDYPLLFKSEFNNELSLDMYGCYLKGIGECIIFPSKENRDWSTFKPDYPIDTPMMVKDNSIDRNWRLRYYAGNNHCYSGGRKEHDSNLDKIYWKYCIPVSEFNFNNPEKHIK